MSRIESEPAAESTRIAVLGAGRLGAAIATLAVRHGHRVAIASRSEERLARLPRHPLVATTLCYRAALESSDLAFMAVAWEHMDAVVGSLTDARSGILVDCSNPEGPDGRSLVAGDGDSGGERLARRLPKLRVVKALNHVYAELLLADGAPTSAPTALFCGDDRYAKDAVRLLLSSWGFDPLDCGPLTSARYLEPVAMLMVELVRGQGWGPSDIALQMPRRRRAGDSSMVRQDPRSPRTE